MPSNSDEIITTLEDGVRILLFNRPKSKNAITGSMYKTIYNTLKQDANNDDVRLTIITGRGDYYSSGFDIKSAMQSFEDSSSDQKEDVKLMIDAFINYPKLIIALINGPAIGVAVTTAILCDIVYASDRATFETPFVKIGLCAEGCSSFTFPAIMGRSKASEMLLLGKKITAQEAYQSGLVAKVFPHENLSEFLLELKKLSKLSQASIKASKQLIMGNLKPILCERNEKEVAKLNECFESDEFSEAMISFMNKTKKSKL